MVKNRQWILDGDIVTLKDDLAEMRQDGNGEHWHALKHTNEEQWHAFVDEEITALRTDLSNMEEMKAGVNKMMPLFQRELEMINENTYRACQDMKAKLQTAEKTWRCLGKELRGLSWFTEPTEVSQPKCISSIASPHAFPHRTF